MIFKNTSKTENIVKRKSYYGFASNYPGRLGSTKYVIGESRAVRKRKIARRILLAVIAVLIFALAFVVTDICLNISEMPVEEIADAALQAVSGAAGG